VFSGWHRENKEKEQAPASPVALCRNAKRKDGGFASLRNAPLQAGETRDVREKRGHAGTVDMAAKETGVLQTVPWHYP
jgi:hypothetical protein